MNSIAEDVYYVTRDDHEAIGLNQLMAVPAHLTEVELEAIDVMCNRSRVAMNCRNSYTPLPPWRSHGSPTPPEHLPHGLYYVDRDSTIWMVSLPDYRPDLDGTAMDFAIATVTSGQENLRRLRTQMPSG